MQIVALFQCFVLKIIKNQLKSIKMSTKQPFIRDFIEIYEKYRLSGYLMSADIKVTLADVLADVYDNQGEYRNLNSKIFYLLWYFCYTFDTPRAIYLNNKYPDVLRTPMAASKGLSAENEIDRQLRGITYSAYKTLLHQRNYAKEIGASVQSAIDVGNLLDDMMSVIAIPLIGTADILFNTIGGNENTLQELRSAFRNEGKIQVYGSTRFFTLHMNNVMVYGRSNNRETRREAADAIEQMTANLDQFIDTFRHEFPHYQLDILIQFCDDIRRYLLTYKGPDTSRAIDNLPNFEEEDNNPYNKPSSIPPPKIIRPPVASKKFVNRYSKKGKTEAGATANSAINDNINSLKKKLLSLTSQYDTGMSTASYITTGQQIRDTILSYGGEMQNLVNAHL